MYSHAVLLLLLASLRPLHSLPVDPGLVHGKAVVCYVGTWATYRVDRGQFDIDHIDPNLCSHIVYAFAGLNATTFAIKSLDPYNDLEENYGKGSYTKATSLKARYPHLKVTLAIGGWNEGSGNYSALAEQPLARKRFATSVKEFLRRFNFDGLDLDWEFPGKRGGKPEDKVNFIELIKDLREELREGEMLLTAALGASVDTIEKGYDLPELNRHLDLIHLMCYDYHGSWETTTGPNAPLRSTSVHDTLTVERSVKYVLENGVDAAKLVVGVPFYGRTFLLDSPESRGTLGETSHMNRGFQGPYTKTDGFLGYNEICMELKNGNWTELWDQGSETPFATNGDRVIVYDDIRSIEEKSKFAVDMNLGGVMVWSIDTDDFRGDCAAPGGQYNKYPLLNSIHKAITEALTSKTTPPVEPSSATDKFPTTHRLVFLIFVYRYIFS